MELHQLDVLYTHLKSSSWMSVVRLAELSARMLGARLIRFERRNYSKLFAARCLLLGKGRPSARKALVIAPSAVDLNIILELSSIRARYQTVAGWVIDSFYHEFIPRVAKHGAFDFLYVSDVDDHEAWSSACQRSIVRTLSRGTDTLTAQTSSKTVDLQRLGRMPPAWEDDDAIRECATTAGLSFQGRPAYGRNPAESQQNVDAALASARYVLAFSNLVSPAAYTHPTRDYLTARWTESLAHGAIVAGQAPSSTTARELLWEGATLSIDPYDLNSGILAIRDAVASWTPELAERNRVEARRRLDWRYRLKVVATDLGLAAPTLDDELKLLSKAGDLEKSSMTEVGG